MFRVAGEIGEVGHLTPDEQRVARAIVRNTYDSIEECAEQLRALLECDGHDGWFVHKGGHHVAVHREAGDRRRIAIFSHRETI